MAETSQKISLLIISKFLYNPQVRRWCYLGLDRNSGTVCRPIPSFKPIANERDFFWPVELEFQVGETHEFQIVPGPVPNPDTLPHCNNDVFVIHKRRVDEVGVVGMNYLFENLGKNAYNTIEEALAFIAGNIPTAFQGKPYVDEGTNCQSFGIYKCTSGEALRLSFHDPLKHPLPVNQAQDVLVVIETARPLSGLMEFNPRRCFLVEAGVLFIQPE